MSDKPTPRQRAQALAKAAQAAGWPRDWFDDIYTDAADDPSQIPWADLTANPNLTGWLDKGGFAEGLPTRALVVGCGLGDDAEALSALGIGEVVAFDIAKSAVAWCGQRFPDSRVRYTVADALAPPEDWIGRFDFIFEAYTLQVLPSEIRHEAITHTASLLAPGGSLLVVARGRDPEQPTGSIPWPLTRAELLEAMPEGVEEVSFEDYMDGEATPVRRFRALYTRRRMTP